MFGGYQISDPIGLPVCKGGHEAAMQPFANLLCTLILYFIDVCSCRVRGVEGGCAKHLTMQFYTVVMLLTFILITISILSPLTFQALNIPFSAVPSHHSLPFLLFRTDSGLFTDTSEHIHFLLFSFSVFPFLVVDSVR